MASSLPTENAVDMSVDNFGIGTYDSSQSGSHGEDSNVNSGKKTMPDGGGPLDPFGPDRLLGYPQTFSFDDFTRWMKATTILPGDTDRSPEHKHPNTENFDSRVMSVSESKLPSESHNPSARSDYYDHMTLGLSGDEWPDEDSGAYASSELPGVMKNEQSVDNTLGALGNSWSGFGIEDVSGPMGFPATDFLENESYKKTNQGSINTTMKNHQATNQSLVTSLSAEFLKKFGKNDLTRRHVMAFLHQSNQHQYLTSDIIRCLKLSHGVFIKDVLDEFSPRVASSNVASLNMILDKISVARSIYEFDHSTSSELHRCASDISDVITMLERLR